MNLKNIDFDYWCNAKRDIVLLLHERKDIESVSELSRLINRSFSVTHRHVNDLVKRGLVIYRKIERGHTKMVSLKDPYQALEAIFS